MSRTGIYEEQLPCGGALKVSTTSWEIQYYFPGIDLRRKGTFKNIPGAVIREFAQAYQENWEEFQRLKSALPPDGEFTSSGACGMTIRVGSFAEGVCLEFFHRPVSSEAQLQITLESYAYAERRAAQVQALLQNL